jgi:hypothetical protein
MIGNQGREPRWCAEMEILYNKKDGTISGNANRGITQAR